MTQTVNPQFIHSVAAGIAHWRQATAVIDERNLAQLDKERQNLYRAVSYGLQLAETWRETAVLASQSFPLIEQRGYWNEWLPLLEQALARCPTHDVGHDVGLTCILLDRLGQAYRLSRQLDQAIVCHQRSETLAQQARDERALAAARYNLSQAHLYARNYVQAEQIGRAALTWFAQTAPEDKRLMLTLNILGQVMRFQSNRQAANDYFSQAIELARHTNQSLYTARFLSNQALNLQEDGRYAEAVDCLFEAREILAPTAYELDKITIQNNIGLLYYRLSQWAEALDAFRQTDNDYLRRSPNIHMQALVSNNIGNVLLKQARFAEAEAYLRRAITLWEQANDEVEMANSIGSLAEALAGQSQRTEALGYLAQALILLARFPQDAWAQKLQADFRQQQEQLTAVIHSETEGQKPRSR